VNTLDDVVKAEDISKKFCRSLSQD